MTKLRIITIYDRKASTRCSFCRTNRSVKYKGTIIKCEGFQKNVPVEVFACNRCALIHSEEFVNEEVY